MLDQLDPSYARTATTLGNSVASGQLREGVDATRGDAAFSNNAALGAAQNAVTHPLFRQAFEAGAHRALGISSEVTQEQGQGMRIQRDMGFKSAMGEADRMAQIGSLSRMLLQRDRERRMAKLLAERRGTSDMVGAGLQTGLGIVGAVYGGPEGAALGSAAGGALGQGFAQSQQVSEDQLNQA